MSEISKYRVNGFDIDKNSTEFYFKVKGADEYALGSFCVADDGIYFYRIKSKILTPGENANTRNTFDGYISMENLKELFEALRKAKLRDSDERASLKFKRNGKTVIIEEAD